MIVYIGIDPGASGAIAAIVVSSTPSVQVWDYDDINFIAMLKHYKSVGAALFAVIEKVHSMPKQGVVSTFNFGKSFGRLIGILEVLDIITDFVTPQKWQKAMFDSQRFSDVKTGSLDRARRLFPALSDRLKRKKDHGRSDALLMAEYCRRLREGLLTK